MSSSERTSHSVTSGGVDRRRKVADALLDPLALVGERELRAAVGEHLRDRPGDRALVRDAEDERPLALECSGHPRDPTVPSAALRRAIPLLACCAALVSVAPAAARFVPVRHTGPRVTRRHGADADRRRRARARHRRPRACRRSRRAAAAGSRRSPRGGSSTSRRRRRSAYLRRLEQQQARAAAQIRARSRRRASAAASEVVLDGLTVSLPASKLPALVRQTFVTKVYPSVAYTLALDRSPSVIGADVLQRTTRRRRHRHEDRRRRRRHRPVEPVLQSRGLLVSRRLPARQHEVDDAEGDRRARLPRPELRRGRTARRRSRLVVPRHARRRHRRRRRGHDRSGGRRPSDGDGPERRRAARVARQLPRVHRADADRSRREHAGDHRRLRGGGDGRHGRHQLLRRRPADRSGERRAHRGRARRRRGRRRRR